MTEQHTTESDYIEFSIPLDHDDERSGLLGSQPYQNDGEYLSEPRREVTAIDSAAYTLIVRCRRPIYGNATNDKNELVSAAFIAFNISFQETYASSRFKRAEFVVEFLDTATVHLNPHATRIDRTYQPVILGFEPRTFDGPITRIKGQTTYKLGVGVSDPTNIAGLKGTVSQTQEYIKEGHFNVHGVKRERDISKIKWVIKEDPIKKTGLPKELESLAIMVTCTPGRKFVARVRVEADIRVLLGQVAPMAGKKDDPLYFTPLDRPPSTQLEPKLNEAREEWEGLKKTMESIASDTSGVDAPKG